MADEEAPKPVTEEVPSPLQEQQEPQEAAPPPPQPPPPPQEDTQILDVPLPEQQPDEAPPTLPTLTDEPAFEEPTVETTGPPPPRSKSKDDGPPLSSTDTEIPSFDHPAPPPEPDATGPSTSNLPLNRNSRRIIQAYKPVWWFLTILGQMPFRIVKRGSGGYMTYNLQFLKVSPQTIIYGSCFFIYAVFYILTTCGMIYFFTTGYSDLKEEIYDPVIKANVYVSLEKEYIRKGLIPMMVMWSLMTVTIVGFITVFVKGAEFVQYFNHWNRVVQIIDIDPTLGVRRFFVIENFIALFVATILTMDFVSGYIFGEKNLQPGQGFDRPATLANMVTRLTFGKFYDHRGEEGKPFFTVAFFIMTYGIIASRCQIVAFLFFSKLLKHACEIWNERLRNLLKGEAVILNPVKQSNRRISYTQLLKDHLILVQLFKMTEATFGISLISYYTMNVFSIIQEMYFLITLLLRPLFTKNVFTLVKWNRTLERFVRIQKDDTDPSSLEEEISQVGDPRLSDDEGAFSFAIISMLMVYQVFYTLQLTDTAASAYEQAMNGFQILRRYGFMHCKSPTERNFIHTLVISFAPNNPMRLTGGGYFSLDKALIAGMMATIINFVIFMNQFKPDEWGDMEYNWEQDT